jgi:hypothetical protein
MCAGQELTPAQDSIVNNLVSGLKSQKSICGVAGNQITVPCSSQELSERLFSQPQAVFFRQRHDHRQ